LTTNATQAATLVLSVATTINAGLALSVFVLIIALSSPVILVVAGGMGLVLVLALGPVGQRAARAASMNADALRELQLDATTLGGIRRDLELYGSSGNALADLRRTNDRARLTFQEIRFTRVVSPLYQLAVLLGLVIAIGIADRLELDATTIGAVALLLLRSLSHVQQINVGSRGDRSPALAHRARAVRSTTHCPGAGWCC
jgi:hypothetical protein